ncbi:MAG TPA: hypothetical protein ENN95_00235, partial [Deltaproteobacteria bacterium]|nr:hypothetical protein [Deltaproteobacteria bacterium]
MSMRKIINEYKGNNVEFPDDLLDRIKQAPAKISVSGLEAAARAFMAGLLFERDDSSIFIICAREKEALAFAGDLAFFLGENDVFYYPPIDLFAVELFSFPREEELMRLALLARLRTNRKTIIVTHAGALSHKIMPLGEFNQNLRGVSLKDTLDRDELTVHLDAMGYKRVSLVEEAGEFSVRGNIIDIFPPLEKNPLRVELSADEIESIRAFDNVSQRSLHALESFTISPASQIILKSEKRTLAVQNIKRRADELSLPRGMRGNLAEALKNASADIINPVFLPLFYDEISADGKFSQNTLSSIFDYLPLGTLLILDGSFSVRQAFQEAQMNIEQMLFKTRGEDKFYLDSQGAYFNE